MAETDSSKKIRTFLDNKLDDFLGFAKVDQNSKDVELLKRLGRVYQSLVFKGKALQLAFKFANTHANHSDKWVVFNVALLYTKLINKNVDAKSDALKFLARFALQSFAKGFNARELAVVIKLVELYQKLLWNNFADAYQPALEFANAHGQSTDQFNITESLSELYRLLLEKDVAGSKKAALEFAKRYSSRDEISIKTKLFELYKKLIDDGFTNAYKPAEKYLQSNEKEEKLKADCIEIYTQLVSKGSISAYKPALKFARSIRERNDFDDLFNLYMAFIDKNVKEAYKPALEFAKLSNDTRHKVSLYVALIKKGVQGADAPAKTLLTEWGDYLEQALPAAYEFLID